MFKKSAVIFVLFALCVNQYLADDEAEELEQLKELAKSMYDSFKETCIEETNANKEAVEKMENEKAPNNDLNCYVGCICQKMQMITPDGKFNQEALEENIGKLADGPVKDKIQDNANKIKDALKDGVKDKCEAGEKLQPVLSQMV